MTQPTAKVAAFPGPLLDPADPLRSADAFLHHLRPGRLTHHDGAFYLWERPTPHYRHLADAGIRARLYEFLEGCRAPAESKGSSVSEPFAPTSRRVNDVLDALKARTHLSSQVRAPSWLPGAGTSRPDPYDIIAFRNGLLDTKINADLYEMLGNTPAHDLLPLDPNFFNLFSLPFDCQLDSPPPTNWLAFVESLWPDDPDSRCLLQEWTGLLLTPITRFHKMLVVIGPSRSGKGSWARVVRQLMAPSAYVSKTFAQLIDRFGTETLTGASVVMFGDSRLSSRTDTSQVAEILLGMTGDDFPSVRRKNVGDWQGRLFCRPVILSNELPRILDASGALASRCLLLKIDHSWLGREDPELESRFIPELPGILNWALEGLYRLLARGRFVQPNSARDLLDQLGELGSPVRAFVSDECEVGDMEYEVGRGELYDRWREWCKLTGHKPTNATWFSRDLRAAFPRIADTRPAIGERARRYVGIRLRDRELTPADQPIASS